MTSHHGTSLRITALILLALVSPIAADSRSKQQNMHQSTQIRHSTGVRTSTFTRSIGSNVLSNVGITIHKSKTNHGECDYQQGGCAAESFISKGVAIRGGSTLPTTMAKTYAVLSGAQGVVGTIGSERIMELYGLPTSNLATNFLMHKVAAASCMFAIAVGAQLFYSCTREEAIGYSCLPLMMVKLYSLATGRLQKTGLPVQSAIVGISLNAVTSHAGLTGASYVKPLFMVYGLRSTLNAVICGFFPGFAAENVMRMDGDEAMTKFAIRLFGIAVGAHALILFQPFGISVVQAVGLAAALCTVFLLDIMFVGKDLADLNLSPVWMYPLLLFSVATAVITLLP